MFREHAFQNIKMVFEKNSAPSSHIFFGSSFPVIFWIALVIPLAAPACFRGIAYLEKPWFWLLLFGPVIPLLFSKIRKYLIVLNNDGITLYTFAAMTGKFQGITQIGKNEMIEISIRKGLLNGWFGKTLGVLCNKIEFANKGGRKLKLTSLYGGNRNPLVVEDKIIELIQDQFCNTPDTAN